MTTLATTTATAGRLARAAALGLAALAGALAAAAPVPAAARGGRHPGIDCRCRANGHDYGLGERACLSTPAGLRVAECRMVQNVTSWSVMRAEECGAVSGLVGPRGAEAGG